MKARKRRRFFVAFKPLLSVLFLTALFLLASYYFISPKTVHVEIRDDAPWFFPAVLEIKPGTTVAWHRKTPAIHPIMSIEEPDGIGSIHSGHFTKTWSHTFTKRGLYVYICPIHPYMKGVIAVGMKVPAEKIPSWINWPPPYKAPPGGVPTVPGKGSLWLAAQFHYITGKEKPGTLIVINAQTWELEKILDDPRLNHPHNVWEIGGKILVTKWFDVYVSVVDKTTGTLEKHVWVGESPAHIHSHTEDKIYVTLQGDDAIAILNKDFDLVTKIRAPTGPHGHWLSADGSLMSLASTEKGMLSVWNTTSDTLLFETFIDGDTSGSGEHMHAHSLPLMAGITPDGRYAFAAASATGTFSVVDVKEKKLLKSFDIGQGPIQTVPSPDGRYVLVPLSGSGEVAVISTETWDLVKTIPNVGAGAHGVDYGEKQDGGWYAYVSNKFSPWLTVVDMATLDIAGYVPLPNDAWGGQGILVVR